MRSRSGFQASPSLRRHRNGSRRRLRRATASPSQPADACAEGHRALRACGDDLLVVDELRVQFGGLRALDGVSLSVPRGTVTGLVGPNGAGKTTLFDVATGARRPTAGRVLLDGMDVTMWSRHRLSCAGVARTFQNLSLFESLTVLENVLVGASRHVDCGIVESMLSAPRARADERRCREVTDRALDVVGLAADADALAGDLPYGSKRRVEIARALALGPRLLLLDEPSAGMDAVETAGLGDLVNQIVDRLGVTVLLVEHDMSMVRGFVDRLHVLDFGRILASGTPEDVLAQTEVIEAYLGAREARDARAH